MKDRRPFDVMVQCSVYHEGHNHPVILAYDQENPAAVELVFMPEMVSWIFGRDVLFQAAIQGVPDGEGDIHAYPAFSQDRGSHVVLSLREYAGDAYIGQHELILDRRTAQKFLYQTLDLVQLGEETYDAQIDAFLMLMQAGTE
jgi:hypothetical protein